MDLVLGISIFIMIVLIIEVIGLSLRIRSNPEVRRVRKILKSLSTEAYRSEIANIMRKRSLSSIPWLNRGLLKIQARTPIIRQLDNLLLQADATLPLGVFILISLVLALIGFAFVLKISKNLLLSLFIAAMMGIVPFFSVCIKRKRRMRKFERQLPDALDMIARALRAGHAFSSGMQMIADEFNDPIGGEFETTISQINFGVSFQDALKSLSKRIDCPDLKFFSISIIIQKQSGGNLAEILDNIGHIIRERFKLRNHIRALSAEGKLSAIILFALPFFIFLALFIVSKDYIMHLITEPLGRKMIVVSLIMMSLGILWMKKIISIKI